MSGPGMTVSPSHVTARHPMLCKSVNLLTSVAAVAALAGLVVGCGGGSGSGTAAPVAVAAATAQAPAPSPSPTPTPTPSPTPTPAAFVGPAALTQVRDFAVLGYSVTGTTARDGSGPLIQQPGGVAFRYVVSQSRHEIQIPGRDWGVLGAPFVAGRAFSTQRVTVGTGPAAFVYDLNLFVPGDRNPDLPLVYTSYGSWAASALRASDPERIDQNFGTFAYGVSTPNGAVPRTGTAQYRGLVFDPYDTLGDLTITFDFATRQVTGSIKPFFNDGIGGISSPGAFPFSGSIQADATAFQIGFPIGSTGRTGLLEIQLTGPNAEELMLRWSATIVVPHLSLSPQPYILPGVARRG